MVYYYIILLYLKTLDSIFVPLCCIYSIHTVLLTLLVLITQCFVSIGVDVDMFYNGVKIICL